MEKTSLENQEFLRPPKKGDIIEGKIIKKGESSIFLDLGVFKTGIIYGKEFQEAKDVLKNLKIGDTVLAKIIELENEEGYVELSVSQAGRELGWESLKKKQERGETQKVRILGANKGGLLTEIAGVPAFLPVSQLSPEHYPKVEDGDKLKILRELQKFIGRELEVKIFDLDPKTEKLILSEKAKEIEKIKEILKNYKVGDIVEGKITAIVDFGAFMKFGKEKLDGLIHISELDWGLVENPSEIVKVGGKVKTQIIEISDEKVFLSLKSLKEDPWKGVEEKFRKGDIVKGKVVKLNSFGAFIEIYPKIQGLIHISEFGSKTKMESALGPDKIYDFKILLIDCEKHRINLSLVTSSK